MLFKLKINKLFSDTDRIENLSDLTDYENIISDFGYCFFDTLHPSENDLEIVKEKYKNLYSEKILFEKTLEAKKNYLLDIMSENFIDDIRKEIICSTDVLGDFFKNVNIMIGNDTHCYSMEDSLLYVNYDKPYRVTNVIHTNKEKVDCKIKLENIDTLYFSFSMYGLKKVNENIFKEDWKKISKKNFDLYINSQLKKLEKYIEVKDILEEYAIKIEDEWTDIL